MINKNLIEIANQRKKYVLKDIINDEYLGLGFITENINNPEYKTAWMKINDINSIHQFKFEDEATAFLAELIQNNNKLFHKRIIQIIKIYK